MAKVQTVKLENGIELPLIEHEGRRVITFEDVDRVHQRPSGTAKRNFNSNKERFIKGQDYFCLKGQELNDFKAEIEGTDSIQSGWGGARRLILLTEMGYLMVTKSLRDDLAWQVQRTLVMSYFRTQHLRNLNPLVAGAFQKIEDGLLDLVKLSRQQTMDVVGANFNSAFASVDANSKAESQRINDIVAKQNDDLILLKNRVKMLENHTKQGEGAPMRENVQADGCRKATYVADRMGVYSSTGKPHAQLIFSMAVDAGICVEHPNTDDSNDYVRIIKEALNGNENNMQNVVYFTRKGQRFLQDYWLATQEKHFYKEEYKTKKGIKAMGYIYRGTHYKVYDAKRKPIMPVKIFSVA